MLPTLKPGQDVLIWCWFYNPKVGEIVAVKVNGRDVIKRVQKVHDRNIFVQGDNKEESIDSRRFGWVNKSQIIGKLIYK